MEQFNLEKYLANPERKVVTRDGRPVRILCTDRERSFRDYPIVALVKLNGGNEAVESFTKDGNWWRDGLKSKFDLFFAPKEKNREGEA